MSREPPISSNEPLQNMVKRSKFDNPDAVINKYFDRNVVTRFTDLEMKFWTKNFAAADIESALTYSKYFLGSSLYRLQDEQYKSPVLRGPLKLDSYASSEDRNPAVAFLYEKLRNADTSQYPISEKFVRSIIALSRMKSRMDEESSDLELDNRKLESLREWLRDDKRLNYLRGTPVYIANPKFKPINLKLAALYIRERYINARHRYDHLRNMIRDEYHDKQIRNLKVKILDDKELDDEMMKPGINFNDLTADDIIEYNFAAIENPVAETVKAIHKRATAVEDIEEKIKDGKQPWLHDVWRPDVVVPPEEIPVMAAIKRLENVHLTAEEIQENEMTQKKREFHQNFRPSIAALARNVKRLEKLFADLELGCNKLEQAGVSKESSEVERSETPVSMINLRMDREE